MPEEFVLLFIINEMQKRLSFVCLMIVWLILAETLLFSDLGNLVCAAVEELMRNKTDD